MAQPQLGKDERAQPMPKKDTKSMTTTRAALCVSLSSVALMAASATAAMGQEIPTEPTQGTSATNADRLLVTAQKREQSIDDVSLAVTAISPDILAASQINTLEDLQLLAPGLTVGNDLNFAKVFIRGVGLSSSFAGIDPSVAVHVDGAVVSQAAAHFTSLYDLERVEVLRGPQGTLYGRNATGGSINLITAKPTAEFEGYVRAGYGNYNETLVEGAVSGPLADGIQGRLSARRHTRDGFGEHTGTGADIDNANKFGIRGQLNISLSDRATNLLSVEHYEEDENSRAVKFVRASFPDTQNPGLVAIGLPDVTPNSRDAGGDHVPISQLDTSAITNTFSYEINDGLTLTAITNWRQTASMILQDFDVSDTVNGGFPPASTSTNQLQFVENAQASQELQLLIDQPKWRAIIGAYGFTDAVDSTFYIGADPLGSLGDITRNRVISDADMDVTAYALFASGTYDLTNAVSLKLGARQSFERRQVTSVFAVASPTATQPAFDPVQTTERDYDDFSPELGVEYRFADGTLGYATYSEGFKSGTANLGQRVPVLIDPETIENIELGLKGSYLQDTLRVNIAAFAYEVSDAQFDRTFPLASPPFFTARLENAAITQGQGLEVESQWTPSENLTIGVSATLYDIEFEKFESLDPLNEDLFGTDSTSVETQSLAGNTPRNTPEWSATVRAAYDIPLKSGGAVTLASSYAAKGEQFYTEFNNPVLGADAYAIVDANVQYTAPDGRLTVNAWGKNLTDEFVLSGAFAVSTSRTITGTYLPPRQYGVSVGYTF